MTAYAATVGSDKGYYARGKLSGAGTVYYFAIEKGGKYYDYGIHTLLLLLPMQPSNFLPSTSWVLRNTPRTPSADGRRMT